MICITNEKKHRRQNETEEESLGEDLSVTYAVLLESLKMHFVLEARNTFLKNIKLVMIQIMKSHFPGFTSKESLWQFGSCLTAWSMGLKMIYLYWT